MQKHELKRLDDSELGEVSGGATVIDGYRYLVLKNDENKIFKYEVKRSDGKLMSQHIFEGFADSAAMDYRNAELSNSPKRYKAYLDLVGKVVAEND